MDSLEQNFKTTVDAHKVYNELSSILEALDEQRLKDWLEQNIDTENPEGELNTLTISFLIQLRMSEAYKAFDWVMMTLAREEAYQGLLVRFWILNWQFMNPGSGE